MISTIEQFDLQSLQEFGEYKVLKKGDYFVKEGSICQEVAYVISGIFRSFYHSSEDEEITYCFRYPQSFIAGYSSFITGNPSMENMQAITDAEIFIIPKSKALEIQNSSMYWMRFFKEIAELEFCELEKRIFLLQKEKAEKRYADLMENHPEYLKEIPLNYLASYLGISQRHLSRIRKEFPFK